MSMLPKVIPLKFDSRIQAEAFVRRHAGKHFVFPHKCDDFWCNMNQSPQEREDFKRNLALLFKVKRAICEVMDADPKRLVIDKIKSKVFNVNGSDLQLIFTMMTSGTVKWEANVDMRFQHLFKELATNH